MFAKMKKICRNFAFLKQKCSRLYNILRAKDLALFDEEIVTCI